MKVVRPRVIPMLLLRGRGLVKTVRFRTPKYVGDPRNAVKIFNDKEVDELALLDITATVEGRAPDFELVEEIVSEAFMPVAYGGGISTVEQARRMVNLGVEKIVVNSAAVARPELIARLAERLGAQSVVVSIDVVRRRRGGAEVVTRSGSSRTKLDPVEFAVRAEQLGAGELIVQSVDRDGSMEGYDIDLVRSVASAVGVPVIAAGGAGSLDDLRMAVEDGKAAAVAAGSLFVFHGKRRSVMISYPSPQELEKLS